MRREKGFTLIELMIVIAIIAIIAAIAIPGLLSSQRAANERSASASLKTLATAEIDFRSNDRDSNRINDFWTGDVAGLFCLLPYAYDTVAKAFAKGSMIKLIDLSIAGAETMNIVGAQTYTSGTDFQYVIDYAMLPPRGPKAGYWYFALDNDNSTGALVDYQASTDGIVAALVHNASAFGFASFPDTYGVGRSLFMINENATVIRAALPSTYVRPSPATFPPNARPVGYENWPSDTDVTKFSRMD